MLTKVDLVVIRKATETFHDLITRKHGVEVAGEAEEWGFCALGPKEARACGGLAIEVVVRVGEDWLQEEEEPRRKRRRN